MGKARNGAGSIRQRKSGKLEGKWRVQWAYNDPVTEEFVSVDRTFDTEREGANFLHDLQAKVRTGQVVEDAKKTKVLTLNEWFDELAGTRDNAFKGRWSEDGMSEATAGTKISRYNSHVRNSSLGSKPIKFLRVDDARTFFREMREARKSAATIKDVKGVLVKILNDAIDTYEKLPNMRNPFAKVKVDTPPPRHAVALTIEQAHTAIAEQTRAKDRAMLGVLFMAGLRLSEVMALAKEQIDFEKGVILIDRSVKFGRTGKQTIGLPKGKKTRIVVMCPSLANLLRPVMYGPSKLVFPATFEEDKPRMKKLVYATWRRIQKTGELPEDMTPQDGRLSHNNWIEKLMPTVSTSTRLEHMGHSVSKKESEHRGIIVNLTNYTRSLSQAHDVLREELERVLGLGGLDLEDLPDIDED